MTYTAPMSDSAGKFGDEQKSDRSCPRCNRKNVTVCNWSSSDGGYEDWKYTCHAPGCGHVWWIDGIDS